MTSDLTHIWRNWASSYIGMICRFAKTNRRYEKCQFPSFVFYAGEGWREHSTHAIQDVNTIKEKKETLQGCTVVIVGDVSHSRVARSNIAALTKLRGGAKSCGSATMLPLFVERLGAKELYPFERLNRSRCDCDARMTTRRVWASLTAQCSRIG